MPGMSSGQSANNPKIVAAFHTTLLHQGLIAVFIVVVMAVAWRALRLVELSRAAQARREAGAPVSGTALLSPEAPGRRALRAGFGLLWALDGFLQTQPQMPLGMTTGVIKAAAAASPAWVRHVANAGASIWSFHHIEAPVSVVWIQVGIGIWLLVAPRGAWSRLAGAASACWGAVVWVFGEAFGGIFAPGLSWLYGAPGAVLFYAVAGALLALPEQWWARARIGRAVLGLMGAFFVGMAVLQAWPGRGFWQGHSNSRNLASLSGMVEQMARTPQPHVLSSWVSAFGNFDAAHGFAVNLFVVVALALFGLAFLAGQTRLLPYAVAACSVLCLADWVLVQDLGFLGGVGTDPNSMVPMAVFVAAGYLALVKLPRLSPAAAPATTASAVQPPDGHLPLLWSALQRHPGYVLRLVIVLGAAGIVLLGVVPMAVASL